jgi:hypothetical protein
VTWGLRYWPAFLVAVSIAFLLPETFAFFTNHNNTLSDYAWHELGFSGKTGLRGFADWFSFIAWSVGVVVLTAHIWFKVPS